MWERCWSAARIQLGLSDDEFFRLTPRRYRLLIDRHREIAQQQELLSGIIAAVICNHSFSPPEKAAIPSDFMPSQWAKRKPRVTRLNRKRIVTKIRGFLMGQIPQGQNV